MPRPKPPRGHRLEQDEANLIELTGLDTRSYRATLKPELVRVVDQAQASWKSRVGPGRHDEKTRNELIAALAELFQQRSIWTRREGRHVYEEALEEFLVRVIHANFNIPVGGPLDLVPGKFRVPR